MLKGKQIIYVDFEYLWNNFSDVCRSITKIRANCQRKLLSIKYHIINYHSGYEQLLSPYVWSIERKMNFVSILSNQNDL